MQDDLLRRFFRRQFTSIDSDLGIRGDFVGIGNPREFLENAGARFGVKTLTVALLANVHRRRNVHKDEPSVGLDHLAHVLAGRVIGCDRRANGDAAVLRDFRGDIADAPDVDVAMLLRESKLGREMLTHQVAVEDRYRPSADFQKLRQQNIRDRGLARTGQTGKENGYALFRAWRKAAPQLLHNFWIGEPRRNIAAFVQPSPKFRAGNVQNFVALLHFIVGNVAVLAL